MPKTTLHVEVGQRIGRGVVLETGLMIPRAGRNGARSGLRAARLICDCGTEYVSSLQALVGKRPENQRTMSCGCLRRERQIAAVTKHGLSRHPLYATWEDMIQRCTNPNAPNYKHYGGRGVTVCERWRDAEAFITDIEVALGPRPARRTLDRWPDNNGNYEPGNVRWATQAEQVANSRPSGEQVRLFWEHRAPRTEMCEQCGKEYETRAIAGSEYLRFCSKACTAAHRRASGLDDIERTCHQCGSTFTRNRYEAVRHCSKSCAVKCRHAGGCPG